MMDATTIVRLKIEEIEENPWNPNAMSDAKFNKLTEEIEKYGFLDPIQVVPVDGKYRIIGGAHRYNAAMILGYDEVPAIILEDERFQDVDLQKFLTLRLNLIKGKMTKDKFSKMYEDLAKRYDEDFIKDAMALVDKDEWNKIRKAFLDSLRDNAPDSQGFDNFDDTVKELKTLDDITKLLESTFHQKDKNGSAGYVVAFGAGGGKIVYFDVDKEIWDRIVRLSEKIKEKSLIFNDVLEKELL